ncbi:transposase [Pseudonocardia sp. NPDC046786]|uniref:transposase n=1 Tax=Pseudonocardia sp. NPDC046786 TaxID=3155471 RepID=UPI0033CF6A53
MNGTGHRTTIRRLRVDIATACRVLAARGLADGVLGHISMRVDAYRMLVRCRGPRERGLAFTEPTDVRLRDPCRFTSEAQFARWCGIAPVALSSGEGHGPARRHRS